ncbi:MAG: hypothetical protein KDC44_09965 [Phaeodactylibacter sp.]|nr:hypothetical protein [Phaeodactylibacter sp.]
MRFSKILFACALLSTVFACSNEPTVEEENLSDQLIGRWEVIQALRNDQPTETMTDFYLEFGADNRMTSNLNGAAEQVPYELKDKVIHQKSDRMPVDFNIVDLSDSLMVLTMSMRNTNFRFTFQKAMAEE